MYNLYRDTFVFAQPYGVQEEKCKKNVRVQEETAKFE